MSFSQEDALGLTMVERAVWNAVEAGGERWRSARVVAMEVLGPGAGDAWGEATVRRHVANIRKKLGPGAIEQHAGTWGYRLPQANEEQEGSVAS